MGLLCRNVGHGLAHCSKEIVVVSKIPAEYRSFFGAIPIAHGARFFVEYIYKVPLRMGLS